MRGFKVLSDDGDDGINTHRILFATSKKKWRGGKTCLSYRRRDEGRQRGNFRSFRSPVVEMDEMRLTSKREASNRLRDFHFSLVFLVLAGLAFFQSFQHTTQQVLEGISSQHNTDNRFTLYSIAGEKENWTCSSLLKERKNTSTKISLRGGKSEARESSPLTVSLSVKEREEAVPSPLCKTSV